MSARPHIAWPVRAARYVLRCDPRILYVLFAAIVVVLTLDLIPIHVPLTVSASARKYFDAIEALPTDKIAIIDVDFGAGNMAECGGQLDTTIRHLLARGIKVAPLTWVGNPEGQKFAENFAKLIGEQMGKREGADYCLLAPLMSAGGATLTALATDIRGTIKLDMAGHPIRDVPMMRSVQDIHDVSVIVRISYQWDGQPWIGFVQGPYGTKFLAGAAAITSSTAYPFVDAGQISGLLAGASGAAQYEQLVAAKYGPLGRPKEGIGTRASRIQSFVSAYVVLAVILGNVAYLIDRQRRRKEAASA
jgi:hypothetical protein